MAEIRMQPITDESAWTGSAMKTDPRWVYHLGPRDVDELTAALARVKARGLPLEEIGVEDFVLPGLRERFVQIDRDLQQGRGFVLVRGFPVEGFAREDIELMYAGFGRHLGKPISQNSYGDVLGHIQDEGVRLGATGALNGMRGYRSNSELLFHTDRADVVGLLCVQKSPTGGLSMLSSSMTVYNEILAHHPEYLPVLYDGFMYLTVEEGGKAGTPYRVPVFSVKNGVVSGRIARNTVGVSIRNGVPFSALELAALKYLDETAARPDLKLDMVFEPGDIQLINSFVTLHSRTEFEDGPQPHQKRHLLRLWLQPEQRRPHVVEHFSEYGGIAKTLTRA